MTNPDPTADDLIDALRADAEPAGAGAQSRVRARLDASILGLASAPNDAPLQTAPVASSGIVSSGLSGGAGLAVAFAVGGAVGAVAHALLTPPVREIVYVDRVVQVASSAFAVPAAEPSPSPVSSAPTNAEERRNSKRKTPGPAAAPGTPDPEATTEIAGLDAELALLDRARVALSARDARGALEAVALHAARYPSSKLEQEREALAVKALVSAGRHGEARSRGQRFLERYPSSMLRDSVESALESIP